MNKIIFDSFSDELTKIAFAPIPGAYKAVTRPGLFGKIKSGISSMLHGKSPTLNAKGKPQLTPGWKRASDIGKGVAGGAALTAGIGAAGIGYGAMTMEPGASSMGETRTPY